MFTFFAIVTTVYTSIHAYIFWRLRAAFGPGLWQYPVLIFFFAMIVFGFMRRQQPQGPVTELIAWLSFIWMGLMLIAVTWFVLLDLGLLSLRLVDFVAGTDAARFLRLSRSVPLVICLVFALGAYALYEARSPRVVRLTLPTAKLPPGTERLRLAAMSDVHIGPTIGEGRINAIARLVEAEQPDMLLMLGDLVDTDMSTRQKEAELLRAIPARLGKFAVFGNHEAYRGEENSLRFTRDAGFTILRGQAAEAGGIIVAGIDDPMFRGQSGRATTARPLLLEVADKNRFVLLLQHRPTGSEGDAGLFDLQISGHTHGGQIWPARFIVRAIHGHAQGLSTLSGPHGASLLYLSNGVGYWGPPMRLWTPPELLIVDLVPEKLR